MASKILLAVLLIIACIFNSCEKSAPSSGESELSGSWIGSISGLGNTKQSIHFLSNNKVEIYVFREDSQGGIIGYQKKGTATVHIDGDVIYLEHMQWITSKDEQFVKLTELIVAGNTDDVSYRLISVDKIQGKLVLGSMCGPTENCIPWVEYHKTSTPGK